MSRKVYFMTLIKHIVELWVSNSDINGMNWWALLKKIVNMQQIKWQGSSDMDKKIIKIGLAMMTCMSVLWSDSKLLLADETDNITNEMEIK